MLRFIFSVSLICCWLGGVSWLRAQPTTKAPTAGEVLIQQYRTNLNVQARLKVLKELARSPDRKAAQFLELEYNRLDGKSPAEAKLAGVILTGWAAAPSATTLPYLIYEGLFHDDPAIVRACADGLVRAPEETKAIMSTGNAPAGRDPADELAAELISRLMDHPESFHALEKVLVLWSGQPRPGYQADVDLNQRPDEAARTAAAAHWPRWFEQRFHQKFKKVSEAEGAAQGKTVR